MHLEIKVWKVFLNSVVDRGRCIWRVEFQSVVIPVNPDVLDQVYKGVVVIHSWNVVELGQFSNCKVQDYGRVQ